jgi:hypothetical protein
MLEFYGPDLIQEIDATQAPVQVAYELLKTITAGT